MNYSLSYILEERAPVWNSTFKVTEAPISYINKLLNTHGRWLEIISSSPVSGHELSDAFDPLWFGLKKFNFTQMKSGATIFGGTLRILAGHLYNKKITILATVGQVIAFPISWVFTPITAIADIFAGVIQATVRTFQGASKGEIQSILHKKVIAAPAQQLAYIINNIVWVGPIFLKAAAIVAIVTPIIGVYVSLHVGLSFSQTTSVLAEMPKTCASAALSAGMNGAIKAILIHSLLLGDTLYRDTQGIVGKLPKFLIPDGYNIFIEGGALDELGDNAFDPEGKYTEFKKQYRTKQESNKRPYSSDFKTSIKNNLDVFKVKATSLKGLRDWFESNEEPYTLFGFKSEDEVNTSKLMKSYHKLALVCHPDKCSESVKEATILFMMVNMARKDIEERILEKR